MGKQKRKRINAESKIRILQSHLMDKKPVSEVCEEHGIQPSLFYNWQRELFARGASVFTTKAGRPPVDRSDEKIAALEQRLSKKDEVIAELLQEYVALKKSLGRAERPMGAARHSRRSRGLRQQMVWED